MSPTGVFPMLSLQLSFVSEADPLSGRPQEVDRKPERHDRVSFLSWPGATWTGES